MIDRVLRDFMLCSEGVEELNDAMLAKLHEKRSQGFDGAFDLCSQSQLSTMLREHVDKGDPVDVAIFCMMLNKRKEAIL